MNPSIADDIQRVRNLKRYFGTRHAAEYVAIGVLKRILHVGFHDRARPLLHELAFSGRSTHKSARETLSSYFTGNPPDTAQPMMTGDFEYLTTEHAELVNILRTRLQSRALAHPIEYQLGAESSLLLYALVRLLSPRVVCETGVANGVSSYFLLHALKKNGIGTLFSFDVFPDVGTALDDSEKAHWELTVLEKGQWKKEFERSMRSLAPIDLFIHDSDHSYLWQRMELDTALHCAAPHAIIACDDASDSYAFMEFCRQFTMGAVYLIETTKVFGLIRL